MTTPALDAPDLCEAFARTVAQRGDAVALRSSDGTTAFTWREFDERMAEVGSTKRTEYAKTPV